MSATIVHAIIVEDNEDDALLMIREVQQQGYEMQWQRVQTASEFRAALAGGSVDVVLADYTLPHFSAPDALAIVRESGVDIPFWWSRVRLVRTSLWLWSNPAPMISS